MSKINSDLSGENMNSYCFYKLIDFGNNLISLEYKNLINFFIWIFEYFFMLVYKNKFINVNNGKLLPILSRSYLWKYK